VLCTALGAIGVFLPSVELRAGGRAVSKRTDVSLYAASTQRDLVRRLLASYRGSAKRHTGGALVRAVAPRVQGRAKSALEDARDAMDTLDHVDDDDVVTAAAALKIAVWTLLVLAALTIASVLRQLVRGAYSRGRLVTVLAASVLAAVIAIALHVVCRQVVWEANDEVGRNILALAPGAYLLPLAALAAVVAAAVMVVRARPLPRPRHRGEAQ